VLKWLARQFERRRGALQTRLENAVRAAPGANTGVEQPDWRQRGNTLLDAGRIAEAARCYEMALEASPNDVPALVNLAFARVEMQQAQEARGLLERVLTLDASNFDAWYMLGGLHEQAGDWAAAAAALRRVIGLQPGFELAYRDLCRVMFRSGDVASAKSVVQRGMALNPDFADFHFYLGNVHYFEGDHNAATACFERALVLQPQFAEAHLNLGKIREHQRNPAAALGHYEAALRLQPDNPDLRNRVGGAHLLCGQPGEAMAHFGAAMALAPSQADAHLNMGSALMAQGDFGAALEYCRTAVRLQPGMAMAHNVLGFALLELGRTQEALAAFTQALALDATLVPALCNLGSVRLSEGRLDDAITHYRQALRSDPASEAAHSNLLFALNYHPDLDARAIYAAYQDFDRAVGMPLRSTWRPFANARQGDRRLRIGYVSPDLRHHTVMRFLEPVLAAHDPQSVEVFAYAELEHEDAVTSRARTLVAHWRDTVGLSDEALANQIRNDRIDILVDVAGHTGRSRLRVFARKPAPVSVSWLGYGYTTGLSAIDYFLTDAQAVPAAQEHLFSEKPWRLPLPALVYRPGAGMGEVGPLPAASRGRITFGTLTRPARLNHRVVRVWSGILRRVPDARLVVDSKSYGDPGTADALAAQFLSHGIGPERLQIGYHSPPWDLMRDIDITLDCFPHNSGTTLFESLYMGVPFVTLAGRPSVGRLGASILHGLGQPDWVAESEQAYIDVAVGLALDLDALAGLRAGLRQRMAGSVLMDEVGFTRQLERAYRDMFARWAALDSDMPVETVL